MEISGQKKAVGVASQHFRKTPRGIRKALAIFTKNWKYLSDVSERCYQSCWEDLFRDFCKSQHMKISIHGGYSGKVEDLHKEIVCSVGGGTSL